MQSQPAGKAKKGCRRPASCGESSQPSHWPAMVEHTRGMLQRGASASMPSSRQHLHLWVPGSLGRVFGGDLPRSSLHFWKDSSGGRKEHGCKGETWGLDQGIPPLRWNEEPLASLFPGRLGGVWVAVKRD